MTMGKAPLAAVFGCSGLNLTAAERAFFRECDPFGFILFARNIDHPDQVRRLTQDLRECVGRAEAPILIDQEGGRVQRLRPPHWAAIPPMARLGACHARDPEAGLEALELAIGILAQDCLSLGVDVDCLPVLDVPQPGAHDVIGDRAFALDPRNVALLAGRAASRLLAGGVLPVAKHIPGHGRALVDSHHHLPQVDAALEELERVDFGPFRACRDIPLGMTAHVVYRALDPDHPATTSRRVITDIIRGAIGFDGLLMSDDLGMKALGGSFADRTAASLAAGCDIALHCSGDMAEMQDVLRAARAMDGEAMRRWHKALSRKPAKPLPGPDREQALARIATLLGMTAQA